MITIRLNGESRDVPENLSLQALLAWLNLPADRVAVECNLEIVPRGLWEATTVQPGDRFEVVHFVGGGSPLAERCSLHMLCRSRLPEDEGPA